MKYSYNWLKDYISGTIPEPKKLAELLMFHSFEIESVEKKGGDWVLDIKVLSNRAADCLSHLGIAREIAAIANCKLQVENSRQKRAVAMVGDGINDAPVRCLLFLTLCFCAVLNPNVATGFLLLRLLRWF